MQQSQQEDNLQITVALPKPKPVSEFGADHFGRDEPVNSRPTVESFFVAMEGGQVVGIIGNTKADQKIVASVVGNWISAGLDVQSIPRKEVLKRLRITKESVELVAEETTAATPATTAVPATEAGGTIAGSAPAAAEANPSTAQSSEPAQQGLDMGAATPPLRSVA